ncbi:MAG: penicillin-binding protein 2 [bacterium]
MNLFKLRPKKYTFSVFVVRALFLLFAGAIIIQLVKLQVFQHHELMDKAQRWRQPLHSFNFRGEIVDRKGIRLAADKTLYDIYAHPSYFENTPKKMAAKLAPLLKVPESVLLEKLAKTDVSTITLAKDIDRDTELQICKLKLKGLDPVKKSERVYPQGNLASHILGYVNFDANLFAGVESTAKDKLQATPKVKPIEYDGRGGVIYDTSTDPATATQPLTGKKITLTIDSEIQHIAETELAKMVTKSHAKRGTVIVMNPKNGEILGFAVLPTYNPNQYNKVSQQVVKNWVLSDVYPPGSTFKILTIACGLESGAINEYEKILDTGKIKIDGWPIQNYDYGKHGAPGIIDLKYLFVHSSNVASLKVALKIPKTTYYNLLKKFGMGHTTGIDLPGESRGIIPPPSEWSRSTQATMGFGYSLASTPIQVAAAVAAIANGGIWTTPHVIKYTPEEATKRIKTRRVISEITAQKLTHILAQSIEASDAKAGKIPNFNVAGKTGTSRKPNPNGPGYIPNSVFTSFVGYFPVKDPQVLMMVVVDDPKGAEVWGSTIAGPIFNSIATEVCRILNLEPDAPGKYTKKGE